MTLHLMATADGGAFDLHAQDWTQINIQHVAHALAQTNRFMGHASRPYSVAEHSLLVADIAMRELRLDVNGQLAALMHDAHEVYCGDLHPYTKLMLGQAWHRHEHRLELAVRTAFGLHAAFHEHGAAIKTADNRALATEFRDLIGGPWADWGARNGVQSVDWERLGQIDRRNVPWQTWGEEWLERFHDLSRARDGLPPLTGLAVRDAVRGVL